MTKQEAIAFAISTGKPITHHYFSDDEFVKYEDGELVDEQGFHLPTQEFWNIRTGGEWEDGWAEFANRANDVEEIRAKKSALDDKYTQISLR